MSRPMFQTERTIIEALLNALADQAADGPLLCGRLCNGDYDADCDDVNIPPGEQCLACRVFTGLRLANDALDQLGKKATYNHTRGDSPLTPCPLCAAVKP